MINKANQFKLFTLIALVAGFVWCNISEVKAQSGDPFSKPTWARPRDTAKAPATGTPGSPAPGAKKEVVKVTPPPVVAMAAPSAQDRINYYKMERERAANEGRPIPKLTSVLTLDEMSISGIFRTPRGFAAMVEAKPIGLSYAIYPGEKFFDGQLVAIEENRLIFRKVVKMSNGKFVTTEESKALRVYSQEEQLQGTAPVDTTAKGESKTTPTTTAQATGQPTDPTKPAQPTQIVSPLDEMNRQPAETPKSAKDKAIDKTKKGKSSAVKKPAKVAVNKEQ